VGYRRLTCSPSLAIFLKVEYWKLPVEGLCVGQRATVG